MAGVRRLPAKATASTTTATTAGPAEAEDDIIPPQGARAGGRANPLGTPHPEPPAVDRESGDAQQKAPRKRTMWTNEEDVLLLRGVQRNGEGNWAAILRYTNVVMPPVYPAFPLG